MPIPAFRHAFLINLPARIRGADVEAAIASTVACGAELPAGMTVPTLASMIDAGQVISLLDYSDGSGCGWRYDHASDAPPPPYLTMRADPGDLDAVSVTGTAADMLAYAGRAMHGARWIMSTARDLAVSDNTVSKWMSGRVPLPATHGVFADLAGLLERRASEIRQAADVLAAYTADAKLARRAQGS